MWFQQALGKKLLLPCFLFLLTSCFASLLKDIKNNSSQLWKAFGIDIICHIYFDPNIVVEWYLLFPTDFKTSTLYHYNSPHIVPNLITQISTRKAFWNNVKSAIIKRFWLKWNYCKNTTSHGAITVLLLYVIYSWNCLIERIELIY